MNLGGIYKDLGKLEQALTSTRKSLELKPDNPTAHMNLGGIYKDLGNLEQALASTLKSLELRPDNPDTYMNLGSIYKDLGNLDHALAFTLKCLELKPDNPTAHMNLGGIYHDLGNLDQALIHYKKSAKDKKTSEQTAIKLANAHYYNGRYLDGVEVTRGRQGKKIENIHLSLLLCLNKKEEFNKFANSLISRGMLNQQGVAAIDHANILFEQALDNGLEGNTLDSVFTQRIHHHEFSDTMIEELLTQLSSELMQSKSQGTLVNGMQTSGNILNSPDPLFQKLKELLVQKISLYNSSCNINTDKNFDANWQKNIYDLGGWAIIMSKGGNLKSHNHEHGWLTGTFYLQMPEKGASKEEGAIEFSHQGPRYPSGDAAFERRVIRPLARDLNIFSSSLFHRTLPFQSEKQRICIAFDISERNDL